MDSTAPLLSLTEVGKTYPSPEGQAPLPILSNVNLAIGPGDTVAIVGPSGSGKSTLLNLVGTLDRPTSGRILLHGEDLARLNDDQLAAIRSRKIGFVFQSHFLLPQCTVLENVLVPTLSLGRTANSDAPDRAHQLLRRVGLQDRLGHRPAQLSGGECQRVAVVRALINRPVLLLADEPTGSLDHSTALQLIELLLELNREEKTGLMLVTHARDIASRMQRVFQVREGRLAALQ